jgi:hypothetical protein
MQCGILMLCLFIITVCLLIVCFLVRGCGSCPAPSCGIPQPALDLKRIHLADDTARPRRGPRRRGRRRLRACEATDCQ